MNFDDLKCVSTNVNLDDYYKLYDDVLAKMEHPEWLGYIPIDELKIILSKGGKIWLYYDNDIMVCSMLYMPSNNESLRKHKIYTDESSTGALGPIMVNFSYLGHGYMKKMLNVFNEYNKELGNEYIFTKVVTENIYSVRNIENDGYELCDVYFNERGSNNAYLKKLK